MIIISNAYCINPKDSGSMIVDQKGYARCCDEVCLERDYAFILHRMGQIFVHDGVIEFSHSQRRLLL